MIGFINILLKVARPAYAIISFTLSLVRNIRGPQKK